MLAIDVIFFLSICVAVYFLKSILSLLQKDTQKFEALHQLIIRMEQVQKDEFRLNRDENHKTSLDNRKELGDAIKDLTKELSRNLEDKIQLLSKNSKEAHIDLRMELDKAMKDVQLNFDKNIEVHNRLQKEKFESMEQKQAQLIHSTEKKLEEMRETVDEKLQKTLNERLGKSFELVGKQLLEVQEGLGEMRALATDVGGLKKVLQNTKLRGNIGEVQLSMLLEQILAPDQYEKNVKTKKKSDKVVEFAIKMPGKDVDLDYVWLPIDAHFPKEYYEQLMDAYEKGESSLIEAAQKNLEIAIKKKAKEISDKYLDPPYTIDFGIMFVPFEGIYAEVVRKGSLLEEIQRDFKVLITGPSTLASLLNALQMGFRSLAIQKRSSEVNKLLGAVKTEFEKFGAIMEKAQKQIQGGLDDLDTLVGTRTNVIRSKLKTVTALPENETRVYLPESSNNHEL
jgi:DNA recombination protein RmuC